jgi:hypothetical protein
MALGRLRADGPGVVTAAAHAALPLPSLGWRRLGRLAAACLGAQAPFALAGRLCYRNTEQPRNNCRRGDGRREGACPFWISKR